MFNPSRSIVLQQHLSRRNIQGAGPDLNRTQRFPVRSSSLAARLLHPHAAGIVAQLGNKGG